MEKGKTYVSTHTKFTHYPNKNCKTFAQKWRTPKATPLPVERPSSIYSSCYQQLTNRRCRLTSNHNPEFSPLFGMFSRLNAFCWCAIQTALAHAIGRSEQTSGLSNVLPRQLSEHGGQQTGHENAGMQVYRLAVINLVKLRDTCSYFERRGRLLTFAYDTNNRRTRVYLVSRHQPVVATDVNRRIVKSRRRRDERYSVACVTRGSAVRKFDRSMVLPPSGEATLDKTR